MLDPTPAPVAEGIYFVLAIVFAGLSSPDGPRRTVQYLTYRPVPTSRARDECSSAGTHVVNIASARGVVALLQQESPPFRQQLIGD